MIKRFRSLMNWTALPAVMFGLLIISSCQDNKSKTLLRLVPVQTSHGWGYRITMNNKPWIWQEFIPAAPGYQSFRNKEEALRVGNLVLQKLQQQRSPAVSVYELDSLKIRVQL